MDRHLHSLPAQPDWIPYRTAYYSDTWGFCLSDSVRRALPDGEYEICVDAELRDGSLTFGEAVLPGRSADEFLISTHACHPAMVNDNLTGLAVVAHVAAALAQRPRRLTYRFLFAPGTIGAIAWLASRREVLPRIRHGLVVGLLGHAGPLHYKQSRRGDRRIDAYGAQLVRERPGAVLEPYSPYGYDERQFCSPGFDLPVGRLTRTPHGAYPEYHTSADDFARLDAAALEDSVAALLDVIEMAETDAAWRNVRPEGEPRLGVHGLYRAVGGTAPDPAEQALLWVLAYADGETPLLEIAARSGHCYGDVVEAVERLAAAGLVARERFPGGDE
jgi:aminopeptidase-like protein